CYALCCPCIIYARTSHRLSHPSDTQLKDYSACCNIRCWGFFCSGMYMCPVPLALLTVLLYKTRSRYNITNGLDEDILKAVFCSTCALVQAEKEVVGREKRRG
ncbi:hypothetical protein BU23DRAFT_366538, partial [Bimuria novae-zelandiae CBS 107.79]